MQKLERDLRNALIDKSAKEIYTLLSDEQSRKDAVKLSIDIFAGVLNDSSDDSSDINQRQETAEFFEMIAPIVEKRMQDPEFLKQQAYVAAKKQWKSVLELRLEFAQLYAVDEDFKQYSDCFNELFKCISTRDRLVNRLVGIAQKDGIEKAIQKETTNAVFRDFFSTPDEYRAFSKKIIERTLDATKLMQERAVIGAGDLGAAIGALSKISEKFVEKMNSQSDKYLETKIKEIYG